MATKPVNPHRLVLRIKGSMNFQREGDTVIRRWVYQNTRPSSANVATIGMPRLQLRKHVVPTDPRAPAVLARRAWFAAGMSAWSALTPTEQQSFKRQADYRHITPRAMFLRLWLLNFPPIVGADLSSSNFQNLLLTATAKALNGANLQQPNFSALALSADAISRSTGDLALANFAALTINAAANSSDRADLATPNFVALTLSADATARNRADLAASNFSALTLTSAALHNFFGNTAYARAASDGDSALPYGTNVRKFLNSAGSAADSNTKTSHTTALGTGTRGVRPFTTSSSAPSAGNYGWGIDAADINPDSAHLPSFAAGTWTLTYSRGRDITGVSGNDVHKATLYRVGASPTYTRTALASSSTNITATSQNVVVNINISPGAFSLAAGEGLMIEIECHFDTTPLSTTLITYRVGHYTGTAPADMKLVFPTPTYA